MSAEVHQSARFESKTVAMGQDCGTRPSSGHVPDEFGHSGRGRHPLSRMLTACLSLDHREALCNKVNPSAKACKIVLRLCVHLQLA